MNNIVVLATFWNEIEWIEASLKQILKIDPIEIIICDGNFDPRVPNYSTDGTKEILIEFAKKHSDRVTLIDAVRSRKYTRGFDFFFDASGKKSKIKPSRIKFSIASQFMINEYRVNQALTFAKMVKMSKCWTPGNWVMSYDADQFYTDELIKSFSITNENNDYQLITADEWTFPVDFNHFTKNYEKRKWNNMPHKIMNNMAIYPTRHFVVESFFSHKHYYEFAKKYHGGVYHHYKFRNNQERLNAGYNLGDRRPPEPERYSDLEKFSGSLPSVIDSVFNDE